MAIKRRVWIPMVMVIIVAAVTYRVFDLVNRGKEVNWLAELWAPFALLSIGLVSFTELLLQPAKPATAASQAPRSRSADKKRQKSL